MIRQSLLTALGLLLAYSGLILGWGDRISRTGQTPLQRNQVKAEEYLYEVSRHCDTVLVGSSISERLPADSLPAGCYNLAMAGMSSLDGLALIRQGGHRPRLLLVETNSLMYGHTSDLLRTIADPDRQWLARCLPFMRQKYQPVGVVKAALRDWRYGRNRFAPMEAGRDVDTAFVAKAVRRQALEWQRLPPAPTLRANARLARQYVEYFRRQGVRVVLYCAPIDARLQQHPLRRAEETYLAAWLPARQYPTIAAPAGAYQTTDGIHLSHAYNLRYSSYLRQQLARVVSEGIANHPGHSPTDLNRPDVLRAEAR